MNEDQFAQQLGGDDDAAGQDPRGPVDEEVSRQAAIVRDLLSSEATWAEPRPGSLDAVLAAIEAERRSLRPAAPRPGDIPVATPGLAPPTPLRRRRGRVLVSAAAATLVVLATATGLLLVSGGDGDDTAEPPPADRPDQEAPAAGDTSGEVPAAEFAILGTERQPDARAVATLDDPGQGLVILLDVRGLAPAAPDTYYQGWLEGPEGKVPIGSFHMHEGDGHVRLWSGVYPDRYPTLVITREVEGRDGPGPVVLTGRIGPDG